MSLHVAVGTFNQRIGIGLQSITGLGFTPKGIMFWGNAVGGVNTRSGGSHYRIGFSDGTTNVSYAENCGNFFNAIEAAESAFSFTQCLMAVSTGAGPGVNPAIIGYGIVHSLDATGFTIDIQYVQNNLCDNCTWNYIAIGGDDVSVKVGSFNYSASGTISVTGLSFEPTTLLGYRSSSVSGPINGGNAFPGFGVASACNLSQYSYAARIADIENPSKDRNYQKLGIFSASLDDAGTVTGESTVTSFNSDGFTISYTGGAGRSQHYMAIGGCASNVGSFTELASVGIDTVDILALAPKAIIVAGGNQPTSSVPVNDFLVTLGAADGTSQVSTWTGSLNNQNPVFKTHERVNATQFIICSTPTGGETSVINSLAGLVSLSNNEFSISWNQVDGVLREFFYLILADDLGTGPCGQQESETGSGVYQQVIDKRHDTIYI